MVKSCLEFTVCILLNKSLTKSNLLAKNILQPPFLQSHSPVFLQNTGLTWTSSPGHLSQPCLILHSLFLEYSITSAVICYPSSCHTAIYMVLFHGNVFFFPPPWLFQEMTSSWMLRAFLVQLLTTQMHSAHKQELAGWDYGPFSDNMVFFKLEQESLGDSLFKNWEWWQDMLWTLLLEWIQCIWEKCFVFVFCLRG